MSVEFANMLNMSYEVNIYLPAEYDLQIPRPINKFSAGNPKFEGICHEN